MSLFRVYYKFVLLVLYTTMGGLFYYLIRKTRELPDMETKHKTNVYFKDVRGINEFKEELEDIVDFLKNPNKYKTAGATIPRGVLLNGPPGTGKTLMAKAMASEAGVSFLYKSGSEFEEIFVGVGSARVRKLFKSARAMAPCIVFIDEIDAIASKREGRIGGATNDCLNQLLTEMDGFVPSDNVIVLAATNQVGMLDKAILRPGRFDKVIHVSYPDKEGRKDILSYYLNKIKYDKSKTDSEILARATTGFSGSQLKNLVNIAALNAIKESRTEAIHDDFEFALDRISMGIGKKNMHILEKDKLLTAYHEGGHTLANLLTSYSIPLHKVTILPRGQALGFTSMLPEEDRYTQSRDELMSFLDVAMGGRVAEELIYGNDDITTGCSSDLNKATDIAYSLVRKYGMKDQAIMLSAEKKNLSDGMNFIIDQEVQSILKESYDRVKRLLTTHVEMLHILAKKLVESETMSAKEVRELLNIPAAPQIAKLEEKL